MKKVLLISNRVMHYRVSVYNALTHQFQQKDWEFVVRSNQIQTTNENLIKFDFKTIPFSFAAYRKEVAKMDPQVVILFLHLKDKVVWPLIHWLKISGRPVIFWNKAYNMDKPNDKLSRLLFRYIHWLADGLIFYSPQDLEVINPSRLPKSFVADNAINFQDFPDIKESKDALKHKFNIPFKKVVLFVGRMGVGNERKKVNHLIEIFREIQDQDVGCVIVGSGLSPNLQNKLNPKNTIYLGEVHDPENKKISQLFKMADVFSIPGHVGLGINQAMYWELPIVTEEGGQSPEIHNLIHGVNGFIVGENDTHALKEKILYLIRNSDVCREFGKRAREEILKNATVENMFKAFYQCVQYVAETPGANPGIKAAA